MLFRLCGTCSSAHYSRSSPTSPGTRTVGPFPEWQTFETDDPPDVRDWNSVPWSYITPALADASGLLIELIRNHPDWWPAAIKAIDDLPFEVRAQFVGILKTAASGLNDDARRRELAAALRQFVGHHRSFPGEAWAMPESELGPLEELHDLLQPQGSAMRHLWLFADAPITLLHPTGDWHADEKELNQQQADAVMRLSHEGGEPLLHELVASNGVNRGIVGLAIGRAAIPDRVKDDFLRRSLLSVDEQESAVAQGIVFGLSPDPGDRTKGSMPGLKLHAWRNGQQARWSVFCCYSTLTRRHGGEPRRGVQRSNVPTGNSNGCFPRPAGRGP